AGGCRGRRLPLRAAGCGPVPRREAAALRSRGLLVRSTGSVPRHLLDPRRRGPRQGRAHLAPRRRLRVTGLFVPARNLDRKDTKRHRTDTCADPGVRTRPTTHLPMLISDLRLCRSEQRIRVSLPEDAGRTHAGPTEPGQASYQRGRMIRRSTPGSTALTRQTTHVLQGIWRSPPVALPGGWGRSRSTADDRALQPKRPMLQPRSLDRRHVAARHAPVLPVAHSATSADRRTELRL